MLPSSAYKTIIVLCLKSIWLENKAELKTLGYEKWCLLSYILLVRIVSSIY